MINTYSLRLSYLESNEARELVIKPVRDFPAIYQPDAVDKILELTRCQPYLVQLTCSLLVDRLNQTSKQQGESLVTVADVEAVVPQVLETGGMYFREFWRLTLNSQQREICLRLASLQEKKVILSQGLSSTDINQVVLGKLVQKEVIEKDSWNFQVPLIAEFCQQMSV